MSNMASKLAYRPFNPHRHLDTKAVWSHLLTQWVEEKIPNSITYRDLEIFPTKDYNVD